MKILRSLIAVGLIAGCTAPALFAKGREPGSVLFYPVHRSGGTFGDTQSYFWTVVSVTNTNVNQSTNAHFQYVNSIENSSNPLQPFGCVIFNRVENLTPADNLSVLTSCHNATAGKQAGYLVVAASDPTKGLITHWGFNYLVGSELVVNASGGMYRCGAIPANAVVNQGNPTDLGDGEMDFDNVEYEALPDTVIIDNFLAAGGSRLALFSLNGGPDALVSVQILAWNDNEYPMSQLFQFKCWFDQRLTKVSPLFEDNFLNNNTPEDEDELDTDCDGDDDYECGWAILDGVVANSPFTGQHPKPVILGAITSGPECLIDGGDLLWESVQKQTNGVFLDN
jgi:hypothetical protein